MEKTKNLKIEYIPLENLNPYEKNARLHTETDLATIENSIREFGMCDPIGIWSENNVIVEGHGRLLALKALGYTEAPCIRLDHLTDEQRRAYALAHNKTAEMSKWDYEMVDLELGELEDFGFEMGDFGFMHSDDIDWADVDELSEESYDKPEKDMLECPSCGHRAAKLLFKKVAGEEDE